MNHITEKIKIFKKEKTPFEKKKRRGEGKKQKTILKIKKIEFIVIC